MTSIDARPRLMIACIAAAFTCASALPSAAEQSSSPPAGETAAPARKPEIEQRLARMPKSRRDEVQSSVGAFPGADFTKLIDKQVVDIRMRDGATLHTEIYTPKNHPEPLPIIYEVTPYGLSPDTNGYSAHLRMYPELIADGYIFALQDSRGRGASGGAFVTGGPLRDKAHAHATD